MDECDITVVVSAFVPVILLIFTICAKYIPSCNAFFKRYRVTLEDETDEAPDGSEASHATG